MDIIGNNNRSFAIISFNITNSSAYQRIYLELESLGFVRDTEVLQDTMAINNTGCNPEDLNKKVKMIFDNPDIPSYHYSIIYGNEGLLETNKKK